MRIIITVIALCTFFVNSAFAQRDSLKYLALGDSYTVGTSELKANSWPEQLVNVLRKKKIAVKSPQILAGAGWTTEKLITEIEKSQPDSDFDLVSLLIGVNNQYRGMDFELFKADFPRLLEKAVQLAQNDPAKVFVLSIPDWGATPFAKSKDRTKISAELSAYNAFIEKECEGQNVMFIEITKSSKNALFDKTLIASDSLHPSKKMYKSWASKARKRLLKQLQ